MVEKNAPSQRTAHFSYGWYGLSLFVTVVVPVALVASVAAIPVVLPIHAVGVQRTVQNGTHAFEGAAVVQFFQVGPIQREPKGEGNKY